MAHILAVFEAVNVCPAFTGLVALPKPVPLPTVPSLDWSTTHAGGRVEVEVELELDVEEDVDDVDVDLLVLEEVLLVELDVDELVEDVDVVNILVLS